MPSSRIQHRAPRRDRAPQARGLLLTFREAAAFIGLGETVLREIRSNRVACLSHGRPAFPLPVRVEPLGLEAYRREDIRAWVRSLRPVERQRAGLRAKGDAA